VSEKSPSREARVRGLINYYEQLEDSTYYPHLHIPDLFALDPTVSMPYAVPDSFIAEDVGGRVPVFTSQGQLLEHESLDFLLGSYLPGGFKDRWNFKKWAGDFYPSDRPGYADIDRGLEFRDRRSLTEYLPEADEELLTPFRYDPANVTVYFPEQLNVISIPGDEFSHLPYQYHQESNMVFHSSTAPGTLDEELQTVSSSDPSSRFFWFKHMTDAERGAPENEHGPVPLADETNGLVSQAEFHPQARFIKGYYATLLTIYGDDQHDIQETRSVVVRHHNDDDDQHAFVAAEEESQALLFPVDRETVRSVVRDILDDDRGLRHELRMAKLYRHIWDDLFFSQNERSGAEIIDNVYDVDPFFEALRSVDYWLQTREHSTDADRVTEASPGEIRDLIGNHLIRSEPGEPRRLRLFGHDKQSRAEYEEYLTEHADAVEEVLTAAADEDSLYQFAEHVFIHSLQHAMSTWATESGLGGSSFQAWYDETAFRAESDAQYQIALYDTIQGGSGTSKQLYKRLTAGQSSVSKALEAQSRCQISNSEDLAIEMLDTYDPDVLYNVLNQNTEQFSSLVTETAPTVLSDQGLPEDEREEMVTLVRHRLSSMLETRPLARFYSTIAEIYSQLDEELLQAPRALEVALELEATPLFDGDVQRIYDRFASRDTTQRDITELADRVEEFTKQCQRACPDCLERRACTHNYQYQTYMLDRRLLHSGLEQVLEVTD